jgi:glutamine amidotransferase
MSRNSIGVVNTAASNSLSVFRALNWLDLNASLVDEPKDLKHFSHVIVPGVSRFDSLMKELNSIGFTSELQKSRESGNAILGLCAGMQIMGKTSEESPGYHGLGWFDFDVKKIESSSKNGARNFHTGWNDVNDKENTPGYLVSGCYYFNHSYYIDDFSENSVIGLTSNHTTFASVIRNANVVGAQFHPEKSQRDGLRFLKSFWDLPI